MAALTKFVQKTIDTTQFYVIKLAQNASPIFENENHSQTWQGQNKTRISPGCQGFYFAV